MANSPSHRFGQIIGDLLEEIMAPQLADFCATRGLYLDKKGDRGAARGGKKVSWLDKFGNTHDLDFVIEKGGTAHQLGRPLAFIEAAWRRYTKHSRNKAQEIQGAILPIAEKYHWDRPFLGAILAGVFTDGSLTQMKSSGFEVMLFPYETIVESFASVGINAGFDESTPDAEFSKTIAQIERLSVPDKSLLKQRLIASNSAVLQTFFNELIKVLDRQIEAIICIPLHGGQNEFANIDDAVRFITGYKTDIPSAAGFRKFEVIVRYSNGDKIDASFESAEQAVKFLTYVAGA